MTIPRLDPDDEGMDVSISINNKLLPYFTVWYQKTKKTGETPAQFALRALKETALQAYLVDNQQFLQDPVTQATKDAQDAAQQDVINLGTEVI